MGSLRGNAVWLAMVAAGVAVGVVVLAEWPERTVGVVRLPYGESLPKTPPPAAAPAQKAKRVAASASVWEPAPIVEPETEEAGRVLAATDAASSADGPAPVPSELELDGSYVQESPEELGAEPLPGAVLTPPVAR